MAGLVIWLCYALASDDGSQIGLSATASSTSSIKYYQSFEAGKLVSDIRFSASSSLAAIEDVDTMGMMEFVNTRRKFRATGFQFCDILNDAEFDSLSFIPFLNGTIAAKNPDQQIFLNLIDTTAKMVYHKIISAMSLFDREDTRRLACYMAVAGDLTYSTVSKDKLLLNVDGKNYFMERLPAIVPAHRTISDARKRFKLAYLLMVHEVSTISCVKELLEILDDGQAIILVHVDARKSSNPAYTSLEQWISDRQKVMNTNVHLAKHRTKNVWGHISLVFTQLNGFWELLDLADWDYVINLSSYDYPLYANEKIHAFLNQSDTRNMNWIEYWREDCILLLN